ncbi:MAG TPA: FAD-dependent oxidoreductase [Candidatus Baltobacteraceae bacterium]
MKAAVDAAIVGAGIVGTSIAQRLIERVPGWRIVLLEAEGSPGTGESRWATGGVRAQFATEANIMLSLISMRVFENFERAYGVDPHFRRNGYLFVTADEKRLAIMDEELRMQHALGVETVRLDPGAIHELCEPLATDDLLGGNYCATDGSIEPATLLHAYLESFRRQGGAMATEARVLSIERTGDVWTLKTPRVEYETPVIVLACGTRARAVAALAGLEIPVHAFARQVFVAERVAGVPEQMPLVVDIDTGWYMHAQRAELLLGGTDKDARPIPDGAAPGEADWDGLDAVSRAATHRMPILADAKIVRAYAGARTLTPDHHAILGPVASHPGLFLATGFSGHGIMHSPAVGILLAEWITEGEPRTWDARPLMLERFALQNLRGESAVF